MAGTRIDPQGPVRKSVRASICKQTLSHCGSGKSRSRRAPGARSRRLTRVPYIRNSGAATSQRGDTHTEHRTCRRSMSLVAWDPIGSRTAQARLPCDDRSYYTAKDHGPTATLGHLTNGCALIAVFLFLCATRKRDAYSALPDLRAANAPRARVRGNAPGACARPQREELNMRQTASET